eukprot:UN23668
METIDFTSFFENFYRVTTIKNLYFCSFFDNFHRVTPMKNLGFLLVFRQLSAIY